MQLQVHALRRQHNRPAQVYSEYGIEYNFASKYTWRKFEISYKTSTWQMDWRSPPPRPFSPQTRVYQQVLDGSDNFPTKYLVSDACEILEIPNVYGAILGFEGQMSVFSYKARWSEL